MWPWTLARNIISMDFGKEHYVAMDVGKEHYVAMDLGEKHQHGSWRGTLSAQTLARTLKKQTGSIRITLNDCYDLWGVSP